MTLITKRSMTIKEYEKLVKSDEANIKGFDVETLEQFVK